MAFVYDKQEKDAAKEKAKYSHLKPGWNENPSNAMKYDSLQNEAVKAEAERQGAIEYAERVEAYNNGEVSIYQTMYPTMKFPKPDNKEPKINISPENRKKIEMAADAWHDTYGSWQGWEERRLSMLKELLGE